MANSKGIGTPATRDGIIHDLIARGYIVDKKGLYITSRKILYRTLKTSYHITLFAAKLDFEIKKIQRGEATYTRIQHDASKSTRNMCTIKSFRNHTIKISLSKL